MINTRVTPDIKELLDIWPMGWTFDLPEDSAVVVAGSYKGRVLDLINQVYNPGRIYGFEPQKWAYEIANERMAYAKNVLNLNVAIGITSGEFKMGEWGTDGCSFINTEVRVSGIGNMIDIATAFPNEMIPIHLAIFNMEGYEFDLLPYMIQNQMMGNWHRFAVQFHHNFGNDHGYSELLKNMAKTHEIIIDNAPQWIYWRKKGIS